MTKDNEHGTQTEEFTRVENEQIESSQSIEASTGEKTEPSEPPKTDAMRDADAKIKQEINGEAEEIAESALEDQASPKRANGKRAKHKKKPPRKDAARFSQTVNYFSACGRCSYFLAGYRVIHGVEDLETAAAYSKAGWLSLSWNHDMRELLSRSYGIQLDVDFFHYDGCCPECGRHFTYQSGEMAEDEATLRIQLRNRRR